MGKYKLIIDISYRAVSTLIKKFLFWEHLHRFWGKGKSKLMFSLNFKIGPRTFISMGWSHRARSIMAVCGPICKTSENTTRPRSI